MFSLKIVDIYTLHMILAITNNMYIVDGAKERLSLYEAILAEDGSFDFVVNGYVCFFHTTSPVQFIVEDPHVIFFLFMLIFHITFRF